MPSAASELTERNSDATVNFEEQYVSGVNPHWVRLMKLLQMNARYERCSGAELLTTNGETILDCLSGYCVHNLGHNHPAVIAAIKDELDRMGPVMLQSHVPERAGELRHAPVRFSRRRSQESVLLQFRQRRRGIGDQVFAFVHGARGDALYTRRLSRINVWSALVDG